MSRPDRTPPPMTIGPRTFAWGVRTFVMGILNVTPDSFSGDGLAARADPVEAAVGQARAMVAEGADLLDIGGESTRPGHDPVDEATETARVVPVIRTLRAALPDVPLSIDTTKLGVARAALEAGAHLLNDVGGTDPANDRFALAAEHGVPVVLMDGHRLDSDTDPVAEVVAALSEAVDRALAAGVAADAIVLDPGIGFGKTPDQNLVLLEGLEALRALPHAVLLGTSRKSTLGKLLDLPPEQRVEGTLATTALGIRAWVDIVRVHDVAANVRAARVADAIVRGWRPAGWDGG